MLLVDLMIANPQGKKELLLLMWFGKATIATSGAFSCASGLTVVMLPHQPLEAPSARLGTFAGCHCHIYSEYK